MMKRAPDGQFIGNGQMLSAWLPTLLHWSWGDPFNTLLDSAGAWCEAKARKAYRNAADVKPCETSTGEAMCRYYVQDAEKWWRRKVVLSRAKAELVTIR